MGLTWIVKVGSKLVLEGNGINLITQEFMLKLKDVFFTNLVGAHSQAVLLKLLTCSVLTTITSTTFS